MADVAVWFQSPEWVNYGLTLTYVNAAQFTVTGNQTAVYTVGRRVRTLNTGGTFYGTITASVYTSLTTVTVTLDSGSLDSGLSEADVGILNPAAPSNVPGGHAFYSGAGTYTFTAPKTGNYTFSGCAPGGGGGGGGGTVGSSGNAGGGGGGGGGAGQPLLSQTVSLTAGQTVSITIGSPGTGGTAGQGTGSNGGGGGSGGTTAIGAPVSATLQGGGAGAGGGGQTSTTAGIPSGLAGGLGGSGYPQGQCGSDGNYTGNGGQGASGPFGGGGGAGRAAIVTNVAQTGAPANGFGAGGGGGGASYGNSGAQAAGTGGSAGAGCVNIEW